ncbi:alpha/beta hydrolase [Methylococcus sp. EFPC2]|uniref:alpha/beta hydrolase n=1 Tax=Methylococcus sp. EFPC2 TaxID=2812648 RepID=UPI00196773A3|nr:alpha/beta hydrolase [Methylococcus sp. EFPC2]QSA97049.1 alpha/beta hydrolase [Methylococcus sp. EFPC2]
MKRLVLWFTGIVVVLTVAGVLAFKLSPWPSVAVFAYLFSKGDQASEAALEKHVPAGIVARRGLAYGESRDEIFDVYYRQGTEGPGPTIVWVHGGGWIGGSTDGIANYMKVLAGHGYTTVAVEYSTGYGATYPKPVQQVNAALGRLVRDAADLHIDPGAVVLAGDSAGAQIAGQIALITTDPAYADRLGIAPQLKPDQLSSVLLLSGAYDLAALDFEGDYAWFLRTVLWAYSGVENFLDDERFRLLSVTGHVTSTFPPSFISSGNGDPLAPQAVALTQKLDRLGVRTDALFFPNHAPPLPHEYQFNLDDPAGQEALKRILAFLDARRGRGAASPSSG